MVWMFMSPHNSYVEKLTPTVMVLHRALGRWLDQEDRALMNGIGAFIKEAWENSSAPPAMWGDGEKVAISKEVGPHQTLNLLAP